MAWASLTRPWRLAWCRGLYGLQGGGKGMWVACMACKGVTRACGWPVWPARGWQGLCTPPRVEAPLACEQLHPNRVGLGPCSDASSFTLIVIALCAQTYEQCQHIFQSHQGEEGKDAAMVVTNKASRWG